MQVIRYYPYHLRGTVSTQEGAYRRTLRLDDVYGRGAVVRGHCLTPIVRYYKLAVSIDMLDGIVDGGERRVLIIVDGNGKAATIGISCIIDSSPPYSGNTIVKSYPIERIPRTRSSPLESIRKLINSTIVGCYSIP